MIHEMVELIGADYIRGPHRHLRSDRVQRVIGSSLTSKAESDTEVSSRSRSFS